MEKAIALVELPPWQYGILNGEPSYDEFSLVMNRLPSRALPNLEAAVRVAGYANVCQINPIYNPDGKLSSEDWQRLLNSDIIGISAITRTSKQSLELAGILRKNPKRKIIFGGPHFTVRYEDALGAGADAVVLREGESTLPELLSSDFQPDQLSQIKGIAFKDGKETVVTEKRNLLTSEQLSFIHPHYNDSFRELKKIPVIETMRGCPFDCEQCQVTDIYGGKFREKSIQWTIEELKRLKDVGRNIFYTADNIAGKKNHLIDLSYAIEEEGLNKKFGICQVTSKDLGKLEIVSALNRMGIKMACVGYESMNPEFLEDMGKPCSVEDNNNAAKILREAGIWNHGMIMTGGRDTKDSLKETLQWAVENLDSAQFFPMGNIPGTRFDKRMREEGKIICEEPSKMDGHHVVVLPENLSPYELQVITDEMYFKFYSPINNFKRIARSPDRRLAAALAVYTNLAQGLTKVSQSKEHLEHLEFLRNLSR